MTTSRPPQPPAASPPAPASASAAPFRLPDIPEKHPDDMTSYDSLHQYGTAANLVQYLGNPDTTIVSADHYIVPGPAYVAGESRYPDLLVAFDVDPDAYAARNGYVVSEQGKPPDFVLEVASRRSAAEDPGPKKDYYERIGVGELWLYDSAGEFYGFILRGYRLVDGRYEPIAVDEIAPGALQGYSPALNLNLRAADEYLGWHDPATGEHVPTLWSEGARADTAEARAATAEARAATAESRAATAEARAETAEARAATAEARERELEAEIRRLRAGG